MRAVAALLLLAVFVVALPVGLVTTIGNPLTGWPDLLAGDVSDRVILDVLAGATWLGWAQFTVQVAAELVTLTGRTHWSVRPGPTRSSLVRALVGAAVVLLPAIAPTQALGATSTVTVAPLRPGTVPAVSSPPGGAGHAVTPPVPAPDVSAPVAPAPDTAPTTAPERPGPRPTAIASTAAVPDSSVPPHLTITASGPHTYWELARTQLGDGLRWREIWDLNAGRTQSDGTTMTSPHLLRPGWVVLLPATATERPGAATAPGPGTNTAVRQTYRVRDGDWLGAIAGRLLGDADRYRELLDHDSTHATADPDHIEPGWILTLPPAVHDRGTRPHASGHLQASARPRARPAGDPDAAPLRSSSAPTPTPGASPSPSAPAGPRAPAAREGTAAAPTDPSPSAPPVTSHPRPGVQLTDGWMSLSFALLILGVASTVWRRRRHRFRYRDLPADQRHDNPGLAADYGYLDDDLQPLPPVVSQVRRAVRDLATTPVLTQHPPGGEPDPGDHGRPERAASPAVAPAPGHENNAPGTPATATSTFTGRHRVDTTSTPEPPAAGRPREDRPRQILAPTVEPPSLRRPRSPSGPALAGLPPLTADGLGLDGPGALGAARALLVGALSATPANGTASTHVITTTATLNRVMEHTHDATSERIPGLQVTTAPGDILSVLDENIHQRQRSTDATISVPGPGQSTGHQDSKGPDPLLLLIDVPPADQHRHLHAKIHAAADLQIHTVLLGPWPPGHTLSVDAHGHSTTPHPPDVSPERIAVLDTPATRGLLRLLTQADRRASADVGSAAQHPGGPSPTATTAVHRTPAPTLPDPAAPLPAPVRIRVLGHLTVVDAHDIHVPPLRQHATQLLVYLALHRDGARLSDLMEVLWPDATLRRAKERLSTEVANLRRIIRTVAENPTVQPVINTGGHYHLDPDLLDIDLWRFQDHLREAFAVTDTAERIQHLRAAVATHTGPLAEGRDYDWITAHREQLRRNGIQARIALSDLTASQDPTAAAALTIAAADLDPYSENLAQRALRALAALGDTDGVRDRLRRLRVALEDIDAVPSAQTEALAGELAPEPP